MLQINTHQQEHPSDCRKTLKMALVVVLLSCSWTCAVVSGTEEATPGQPEVVSVVEVWNSQGMQFLKKFMVFVVKEAMKDQAEQDLDVLRLIDEAVQLRKDLEQGGQKTPVGGTGGQDGAATESEALSSSNKEDVKKSAAEVFRDHKLKTLFRWGKRPSSK